MVRLFHLLQAHPLHAPLDAEAAVGAAQAQGVAACHERSGGQGQVGVGRGKYRGGSGGRAEAIDEDLLRVDEDAVGGDAGRGAVVGGIEAVGCGQLVVVGNVPHAGQQGGEGVSSSSGGSRVVLRGGGGGGRGVQRLVVEGVKGVGTCRKEPNYPPQ